MGATYSNPGMEWDGFRPVEYSLGQRALDLPLKLKSAAGDQGREEDSSIGKLLDWVAIHAFGWSEFYPPLEEVSLSEGLETIAEGLETIARKGRELQIDDQLTAICVTTGTDELTVQGQNFNLRLANVFLEFLREGIYPTSPRWFWYDKDPARKQPNDSYSFFVVHKNKIIREEIDFRDYPGSGFDPAVFEWADPALDFDSDLSQKDEALKEAWAAYWYRRFYKETTSGQLMVLRPDMPELHYYPEGRLSFSTHSSSSLAEDLTHIRRFLWAVVALLVFIAYLLLRR